MRSKKIFDILGPLYHSKWDDSQTIWLYADLLHDDLIMFLFVFQDCKTITVYDTSKKKTKNNSMLFYVQYSSKNKNTKVYMSVSCCH